jgi:hypothetical protein
VSFGSLGGWDTFGVQRKITRSEGNVLFELDGKPALDVYKLYLGDYAHELPGSGLLFPLSIRQSESDYPVVRTILSIDEEKKSLTFAGSIPEGASSRLMKANYDRLIEGASEAAKNSMASLSKFPELVLVISCVGRKLVLGPRVEEEIEAARANFGENSVLTGFYSYGELAPSLISNKCELHNQTMTVTTITET